MAHKVKEVAEFIETLQMNASEVMDAIDRIDNAMKALASSRLSEKAQLVLISHQAKMSQTEVKTVLNALASLRKFCLK